MPKRKNRSQTREVHPGRTAETEDHTLRTYQVGALPIVNRILDRMGIAPVLRQHFSGERKGQSITTATGLLLMLRNIVVAREPVYGVCDWATGFDPQVIGLQASQLQHLNDDRLGRCLDHLFQSMGPELVLGVVRRTIKEFGIQLDELHNDSTTISFYGAYEDAQEGMSAFDKPTVAITYGHSKMHRPDLKQLLYSLTITEDGGVPVYFTTHSGNVVDDNTHQETWNILRQLVGRPDFLYVADCKLASTDNMNYIHRQGGRFVTVLPKGRKEDKDFRRLLHLQEEHVVWKEIDVVHDEDEQEVVDVLSVYGTESVTSEKYRLWWFHSTRKARLDDERRMRKIERAIVALQKLQDRLLGPRTRLRTREQIQAEVDKIIEEVGTEDWLRVLIVERWSENYKQATPGRPGPNTKYVKELTRRHNLEWSLDPEALARAQHEDGVFPLITNARDRTAIEVLRAYKRQPVIEKRFAQVKTDYRVGPVFLKSVHRIQAILCLYFFAMVVQSLIERELRNAMTADGLESLPLYPEQRDCRRPTARRVIDVFEPIQRHSLKSPSGTVSFITQLSPVQQKIVALLSLPEGAYTA